MEIKQQLSNISVETLSFSANIDNEYEISGHQTRTLGFQELDASLFPDKGILIGDIIEVVGPTSSGKSMFSLGILIRSILPRNIIFKEESIHIGGFNSEAFFFDLDLTFSMEYLFFSISHFLVKKVESQGFVVSAEIDEIGNHKFIPINFIEEVIKESLNNVKIFPLTSFSELLGTLLTLCQTVQGTDNVESSNSSARNVLIVDSLSQFYWALKYGVSKFATNQYYSSQFELVNALNLCLKKLSAFAVVNSLTLPVPQNRNLDPMIPSTPPSREESMLGDNDINSSAFKSSVAYRILFALQNPIDALDSSLYINETLIDVILQRKNQLIKDKLLQFGVNSYGIHEYP